MAEQQSTPVDNEEWRPVPGHEGLYEVSNQGVVKSLPRTTIGKDGVVRTFPGRPLKPRCQKYGHQKVVLYKGDTQKSAKFIHQLVLEAFVGPRSDGQIGCHNNGDPSDNRVENLRWDSHSGNARDRVAHGNDVNLAKTHCPQGHRYDAKNTKLGNHGERTCRTCINRRTQEVYHQRAAVGGWTPRYGGECKHGHEFTVDNTYMAPSGYRECRTCRKLAGIRARERKARPAA